MLSLDKFIILQDHVMCDMALFEPMQHKMIKKSRNDVYDTLKYNVIIILTYFMIMSPVRHQGVIYTFVKLYEFK